MYASRKPTVAIVDYGVGNLFSVKIACERVGLHPVITSCKQDLLSADAVILPGVGAYGNAMHTLKALHLVTALQRAAVSGKPFMGICLGMQLLMSESSEFGWHQGLDVIQGQVVSFTHDLQASGEVLKVPQVGWNRLFHRANHTHAAAENPWSTSLLSGLANGEHMYFVHSFYVKPADVDVVLSVSQYGHTEFCSSLCVGNIFACQFHPERSGPQGLRIYRNFAAKIYGLKGGMPAQTSSGLVPPEAS
jgi:glutamine amidotransferase